MRLRPEPPKVTRLSRKVLAGLGLLAGVSIGGALIFALQSRLKDDTVSELYSTGNPATADGLQTLPRDYAGIPQLGPPLPGDLGKPILKSLEGGQSLPAAPLHIDQGLSAAEQKRLEEIEAARTSHLFASTSAKAATTGVQPVSTTAQAPYPDLASLGLAPAIGSQATAAQTDSKVAFLEKTAGHQTMSAERLADVPSPYVLQAGSVIAAALISGIRSDLPGQITAQVTENIHDSPTGRILLIPQGSRLIGQYDSDVGFGQSRVLLVWNRLILPNGKSIPLERQSGADTQGYAGLEDGVDYHWRNMFKAAALSTILGIGANLGASSNESELVKAIRQSTGETINQAGQQIVQRQMDVKPTLTIRPGFPVRVMVTRDIVLEPYGT